MAPDILHNETFNPAGEPVQVVTYATGRYDRRGRTYIGYLLSWNGEAVFWGEDFAGSPMHADDSRECLASLLTFLTLRPGDTDSDYFDGYTSRQREWTQSYTCEALGCEASSLESGEYALPSMEAAVEAAHAEVFERTDAEVEQAWIDNGQGDNPWGGTDGPHEGGWLYWACLPGCLPDGDPSGPFATRAEAVEDCFETWGLYG